MITRATPFFASMIRAGDFRQDTLDYVWQASEGQHEQVVKAIYTVLVDAVCTQPDRAGDLVSHLLDRVRQRLVVREYVFLLCVHVWAWRLTHVTVLQCGALARGCFVHPANVRQGVRLWVAIGPACQASDAAA